MSSEDGMGDAGKPAEVQVEERVHPLVSRPTTWDDSWASWKRRWNKTRDFDERLGLLHTGFGKHAPGDEAYERICLYLDVADGHLGTSEFRSLIKRPVSLRESPDIAPAEHAQKIAQKAYRALCDNFFKERGSVFAGDWAIVIRKPEVFRKIIWFFTVGDFRNMPSQARVSGYIRDVTDKFLIDMINYAWSGWRLLRSSPAMGNSFPVPDEARALFGGFQFEMATILFQLKNLWLILEPWNKEKIDEQTTKKLEELALTGSGQNFSSLEECMYRGMRYGPLAEFVLILKAHQAETVRQKAIQEAKDEQIKAADKLAQLTGSATAT